GPLPVAQRHDVALRAGGAEAPALSELGARIVQLGIALGHPDAQRLDLVLQLEDPLDAAERDALLLGEPLDLTQPGDVGGAVPPTATTGARRGDETDPVVLAQGLRVHAGELGGHG